ncbi:hypothetical protein L596_025174 [Steinernema carpocapsae]|uniref:Uncharacterized protein n=1 Tax=Steinernema carpocapsae TaxID=34508 RepID=A0A4U5M737_STECR|nr:hypothetical protein L596_025174 [Steinernema carpocapsae]
MEVKLCRTRGGFNPVNFVLSLVRIWRGFGAKFSPCPWTFGTGAFREGTLRSRITISRFVDFNVTPEAINSSITEKQSENISYNFAQRDANPRCTLQNLYGDG